MNVGDKVVIRSGHTGGLRIVGTVIRISKTAKVVTVARSDYMFGQSKFYAVSLSRYVENPGAGIAGAALNDYFSSYETPDEKTAAARAEYTALVERLATTEPSDEVLEHVNRLLRNVIENLMEG